MPGRAQQPVEAIVARTIELGPQQPRRDLLLQYLGVRLPQERLSGPPGHEGCFRVVVEGAHAEVGKDRLAVSPARATGPLVPLEDGDEDADLCGQMREHYRGELALVVREAGVEAVEGELGDEPKAPDRPLVRQQVQVGRPHRPGLV